MPMRPPSFPVLPPPSFHQSPFPMGHHPNGKRSDCGAEIGGQEDESLPFYINVAHLFPCDAEVVQDHVLGVPNNTTQEKPMEKNNSSHMDSPPTGGRSLTEKPRNQLAQEDFNACLAGYLATRPVSCGLGIQSLAQEQTPHPIQAGRDPPSTPLSSKPMAGVSHLLALRGVMLKAGPGCPRALGNRSIHICSFP